MSRDLIKTKKTLNMDTRRKDSRKKDRQTHTVEEEEGTTGLI